MYLVFLPYHKIKIFHSFQSICNSKVDYVNYIDICNKYKKFKLYSNAQNH